MPVEAYERGLYRIPAALMSQKRPRVCQKDPFGVSKETNRPITLTHTYTTAHAHARLA
jgi:hypothetical protein